MNFEEMKTRIELAANALKIKINNNTFNDLEEFINFANPKYPTTSIEIEDAAAIIFKNGTFPGKDEMEIMQKYIDDAEFTRGDENWSYDDKHCLTFKFWPKKTGGFYEIKFQSGDDRFPLCFPITVEGNRYADMDEIENHGDECPLRYPDMDDYEEAFSECYCESFVEFTKKHTFSDNERFKSGIVGLLRTIHWGNDE